MAEEDDVPAGFPATDLSGAAIGLGDLADPLVAVSPDGGPGEATVTYHFPVEIEVVRETAAAIDHAEIADAVLAMLAKRLHRT